MQDPGPLTQQTGHARAAGGGQPIRRARQIKVRGKGEGHGPTVTTILPMAERSPRAWMASCALCRGKVRLTRGRILPSLHSHQVGHIGGVALGIAHDGGAPEDADYRH